MHLRERLSLDFGVELKIGDGDGSMSSPLEILESDC